MTQKLGIALLLSVASLYGQAVIVEDISDCQDGWIARWSSAEKRYKCSAGIATGAIVMITSGTCGPGYAEASELNGVTVMGTLAANGDVGTTGGSDSLTPSGTVSQPTFTGSPLATHMHGAGTFAVTAASAGTPAGAISWPAGVPAFSGSALGTHTHTFTGSAVAAASTNSTPDLVTSNTASSGVSPVTTATGTNSSTSAGTPSGTVAWPADVPSFLGNVLGSHPHPFGGSSEAVSAGTPAGTVSQPTFAGSAGDNRSAFVKVIFCRKS